MRALAEDRRPNEVSLAREDQRVEPAQRSNRYMLT